MIALELNLNLKQELKFILTQEMKFSMEILRMPISFLSEFIEKEKSTNEAIEVSYVSTNKVIKKADNYSYLEVANEKENFFEYLENQLSMITISNEIKHICLYILNNLDNRGYLAIQKDEIMRDLKIKKEQLKQAFDVIHSLEPIGIGAESLKDCLKIQLKYHKIENKHIFYIVDYFLEELGYGKYDYIAKKLKIEVEQVVEILRIIRTLNPIPARGYVIDTKNNYVVPEAKIEIIDNEIKMSLNQDVMPKLKINSNYCGNSIIEKQNIHRALCLIKAVEKRCETLEKILNILVKRQSQYFLNKKGQLQNIVLRDISKELNLHPSTISRAIKEKYILTPNGTISLKSLLVRNSQSIEIKNIIEDLVKNEDRETPTSDSDISKHIKENYNINVSRRTIAKYREELGISSTRSRRIKN